MEKIASNYESMAPCQRIHEKCRSLQEIQGAYLQLVHKIISRIQDLIKDHEQEGVKAHIHRWQKQEPKHPKQI